MNDMKEDSQALFDIARDAHEPTSRDRERVLRGVLARGAIAAGVTSATVGSAAAKGALVTARTAATLKILAGFALLGAAGTGAYRASTSHQAASAVPVAMPRPRKQDDGRELVRASERQPAADSAPTPAASASSNTPESLKPRAPSSPSASAVERAAHETTATAAARDESVLAPTQAVAIPAAPALAATQSFPTSAAPAAAVSASAKAVTLTREARALAEVQRALREGRSAEALAMLASQNREFAGGGLGQEREAARIMALCAAGRVAEGRAAAESFLAANAGSPVAAHIRSSCGLP
jgi:hypothetical protein